jgi:hypothetical protein
LAPGVAQKCYDFGICSLIFKCCLIKQRTTLLGKRKRKRERDRERERKRERKEERKTETILNDIVVCGAFFSAKMLKSSWFCAVFERSFSIPLRLKMDRHRFWGI